MMESYDEFLRRTSGLPTAAQQGITAGLAPLDQAGGVSASVAPMGIISPTAIDPSNPAFLQQIGNTPIAPAFGQEGLSAGLSALQSATPEQKAQLAQNLQQVGNQMNSYDYQKSLVPEQYRLENVGGLESLLKTADIGLPGIKMAYNTLLKNPALSDADKAQLEQFGSKLGGLESDWSKYQGADPYQAATLYNQITSINKALDNKNWSGSWMSGGENAAKEAAVRLNKLGVDNLADLKVVPKYMDQAAVEMYQGQVVQTDDKGKYIGGQPTGSDESYGFTDKTYLPADAKTQIAMPSEVYTGGETESRYTEYVPLKAEDLKTYDPKTGTFKQFAANQLIDASTGKVIAESNKFGDANSFIIDQYDTGNFFKGKNKTFGIQIAKDGTPIPFTTTEKEGLVYSPVFPMLVGMLLPGIGTALSSTISSALPGAAVTGGAGAAGAAAGIGFVPATAMNTALSSALSSGIMSGSLSALGGGSFGKGFLGGAVSPLVGAGIGSLLPTGMDPTVAKAITQGASSGVQSAIGGGDFIKGALGGAAGPLVSDLIGKNLPTDLSPAVRNAITGTTGSAINAAIRGGDVGQALLGGVLSGALNYGADKLADTSTIPPQAINLASGILAPALMGKKLDPITVMSALMSSANPYGKRSGATPYSR